MELGLTLQPFLIVVGESYTSITETYIVIDNNKYKASSILQGIDFVFKAFHVLHAKYPAESEHIWLILERALYKIDTSQPITSPGVLMILKDLGCN